MPLALAAGLRVNYSRVGAGSPLLLLHGWGNSSGTLEGLARALAGEHDCIVPDLPGFGRSETPKEPAGWDVARHAEWLAQFMDKLKLERADIFGHSHGGRIAAYLAATRPDRVERLVICAGAGLRERLPLAVKLRRWRIRLLLRTAHRAAAAGLLGKSGPERARALSERYASPDYRAAGAMRPTLARVLAEDLQPLLPRVQAPTLLIWGDEDRETPLELGERSARLIPHARLVVLPGAGHHPFVDQPERVANEVRAFLQRAGEGAA
ncbi:MAG TPA: alpha/beta hydrolase [Dehalococcoidia bacterium]|nr:alpha/beta hydrolase [Dehalococcoidia bacterium]